MDVILMALGVVFLILGLLGCVLPVIPGPPFSFVGVICFHFTDKLQFTHQMLLLFALLAIVVTVLDYIVPIWGTKKFGGTKAGIWGSTIGLIVGIILLPMLGIVIGPFGILGILGSPFLGALIGEKMAGQNSDTAMKAAIGSFLGFLVGTLIKLVVSLIITWYSIKSFF